MTSTTEAIEHAPRYVAMDPRVQFGRACIRESGIPTAVIAERYTAGDSIALLANDYDQEIEAIEEAIRCELAVQAA